MNPHGIPYLRFTIPLVLGITAGAWMDVVIPGLEIALLLAAVMGIWLAIQKFPYRFRWFFGTYMHCLLLGFGYFHVVQYNELQQAGHFSAQKVQSHAFIGVVDEAPSKGTRLKVVVRVEAAGRTPDSVGQASGHVILFLEPTPFADRIRYGDRIGFQARVAPTPPPKNPFAFDYSRYLHFQNIHHQAFVKPDSIFILSTANGSPLWQKAFESRDHLLSLLQHYFPTANEYAVASALLVGYTDDLSDELRTAYAETGSMHALAVSGTHIGMLYVGLMFLMARLRLRGRRGRLIETGLVLLAIWAFTFLTGATASVLRASVMFSVYMLGKAFWRQASAWNVLPASAFILLIYNPYLLFNVGFQLSYTAVIGMVFFFPRLYKWFPPMSRWLDEPLQVFLVGVSAQLGTLPLTLFYFHQFPVYFWLAGWVVVFVGALFLWGGAMLVLLDFCSKALADGLATALYYMVLWMNKIIFCIQNIPGGVIRNVWIPAWVSLALYLGLALLGAAMVSRRGKWMGAFAGLLAILGLYRMQTVTTKQAQQSAVIYCVNKHCLIDFFEGDRVFSLSDSLSHTQESFAAQANRTACGMREFVHIACADTLAFSNEHLWIDLPFIQFFEHKMALVTQELWIRPGNPAPVPVEILILSGNPRVSIAECHQRFPFRLVVMDASNSPQQTARWQAECASLGLPCHDIRNLGAALLH